MDAPLLANRYTSASTSIANIGRMDDTEDNVLSIAERLAGNWFGIWEQHVSHIRRSRLFIPVSDLSVSPNEISPFLAFLPLYYASFRDTRRQYDICIDKFRRVINALEELSVLKIRFNLTLTFDDYMNVSPFTTLK